MIQIEIIRAISTNRLQIAVNNWIYQKEGELIDFKVNNIIVQNSPESGLEVGSYIAIISYETSYKY